MDVTPLILLALVDAGTGFMAGLLGIGGMILTPFFPLFLTTPAFRSLWQAQSDMSSAVGRNPTFPDYL